VTLAAARALGLRVAMQDLTTVDAALEHSLGLGAEIAADWPQIEYNSRQYAAAANTRLAARRPELVVVRDGRVRAERVPLGLYSGWRAAGRDPDPMTTTSVVQPDAARA